MKQIARMRNLERRNSLGRKKVEEKSGLIEEKLLVLQEFTKSEKAMLYFSVGNEVKTKGIIERALEEGKKVFLPVTDFGARKIEPVQISSLEELKKNKQGLFEPIGSKTIKASELNLIVVPGVAFDRQGNRIGTGKGFYDNMLRRVSRKVSLVGLCFEENLEERLPVESHDIKMDLIVTDKEIVRCTK